MIYYAYYSSPLGQMTMASDGEYLIGLWFDGQKYMFGNLKNELKEERDVEIFEQTRRWLNCYFKGLNPGFVPSIRLSGSDFRQEVCRVMLSIPYGETMTYGQIADEVARRQGKIRMSAQAIGGAVGHNPISVIVPCHRVVGSNGSLTGYAGGINLKVSLLNLEGVDMSHLFVPKKGKAL